MFDDIRSHAAGSVKYVQENAVLAAVDEMLASQQLQPSPVRPRARPISALGARRSWPPKHQSCSAGTFRWSRHT